MYILGINAYHAGASACLIWDGQLVAAVEEERFRQLKYCAGFPAQAIRYCLEMPFEDIFVQPAASDAGTALGAVYYIYHYILGRPRCFVVNHAYTGPRFTNGRVEAVLHRHNLVYETHEEVTMARMAARLIAEGNVVGWFQGDMEWGPRALGSILADPRRADMKDILNARIKHPERFRPFAHSVLFENVGGLFRSNLSRSVHDQGVQHAGGEAARSSSRDARRWHGPAANCYQRAEPVVLEPNP